MSPHDLAMRAEFEADYLGRQPDEPEARTGWFGARQRSIHRLATLAGYDGEVLREAALFLAAVDADARNLLAGAAVVAPAWPGSRPLHWSSAA